MGGTEEALRETVPPGATRLAPPREFIDSELRARGARLFERIHGEALVLETAARFAAARKPAAEAESVDADGGAGPAAGVLLESSRRAPAEFDPSARYVLAPEAYVAFQPEAVEVRSLHAPGVVHGFPAQFRSIFESLLSGGSLSPQTAAPLTVRSAKVFFSRLAEAGVLVREDS